MTQEPLPVIAGASAGGLEVALPTSDTSGASIASRPRPPKKGQNRPPGEGRWIAGVFLGPAAIFIAVVVLWSFIYSVYRSLFSDGPGGALGSFVWFKNFGAIFTHSAATTALKNNALWLVVVPAVLTAIGLVFAVAIERIRWAAAFKIVVFIPMSISMVAVGVAWGMIYSDQPSRGLANALTIEIHDTFTSGSHYPGEHPLPTVPTLTANGNGFITHTSYAPGTPALLPLVGLDLQKPPTNAKQAALPSGGPGLNGTVWNDFKLGGGGTPGQVTAGQVGLPGITVQAVQNGKVVGTATAAADGNFSFPKLTTGQYFLQLPASNFSKPYDGISWLGKDLITPSIMIAYLWVFAGFAMVLISSGLSAIPRDALEAARMDGATEWQVFRRVTAPLLTPTLLVVFVTLVINVLKIFDIVYIISQSAGGTGQYANVLATQLINNYSNEQYGPASAVGVFLVILVIPFMIVNIRRFRRDQR